MVLEKDLITAGTLKKERQFNVSYNELKKVNELSSRISVYYLAPVFADILFNKIPISHPSFDMAVVDHPKAEQFTLVAFQQHFNGGYISDEGVIVIR